MTWLTVGDQLIQVVTIPTFGTNTEQYWGSFYTGGTRSANSANDVIQQGSMKLRRAKTGYKKSTVDGYSELVTHIATVRFHINTVPTFANF